MKGRGTKPGLTLDVTNTVSLLETQHPGPQKGNCKRPARLSAFLIPFVFNCIIAKAMKKEGSYFALELRDPLELLGGFGT